MTKNIITIIPNASKKVEQILKAILLFQNIYIYDEADWLDYLHKACKHHIPKEDWQLLIQSLEKNGWLKIEKSFLIKTQPQLKLFQDEQNRSEHIQNAFLNYHEQKSQILCKHFEIKSDEATTIVKYIAIDWSNLLYAIQLGIQLKQDIIHTYQLMSEYWSYHHQHQTSIDYSLQLLEKYSKCAELFPKTYLKIVELLGHTYYNLSNYEQALTYYHQALSYYQKHQFSISDLQTLGRIYQNLGIIARQFKRYSVSFQYIDKAIEIFQSEKSQGALASIYQTKATTYLILNQYDQSIRLFLLAEELFTSLDDKGSLDMIYHNLGIIHRRLRQYDKSKIYYLKAIVFCEKYGNQRGLAQTYQNLGVLAWDRRQYNEATNYYKKAINIYIPLHSFHKQAKIYQNLGLIASRQELFEDSKFYYEKAILLYRKSNDEQQVGRAMLNYGTLNYKWEQYDLSEKYILDALTIFKQFDDIKLKATAYLNLGVLYKKNGSPPSKSKEYQLRAIEMLEQTDDFDKLSQAYLNLGMFEYNQDNIQESILLINKSIATAQKTNNQYRLGIAFQNLAVAYLFLKEFETAKEYVLKSWTMIQQFLPNVDTRKLRELAMRLKVEGNLDVDLVNL